MTEKKDAICTFCIRFIRFPKEVCRTGDSVYCDKWCHKGEYDRERCGFCASKLHAWMFDSSGKPIPLVREHHKVFCGEACLTNYNCGMCASHRAPFSGTAHTDEEGYGRFCSVECLVWKSLPPCFHCGSKESEEGETGCYQYSSNGKFFCGAKCEEEYTDTYVSSSDLVKSKSG